MCPHSDRRVDLLRIQVQMCSVDLIEAPEQVLCSLVDIISTRIIGEIVAQGRSGQLLLENIDLIEEQNDTGSHKPARVDYRVE